MPFEYPLIKGINSVKAERSAKKNGTIPYPAGSSQEDVCGQIIGKSFNGQATFAARNDCDELIETLVGVSINLNSAIDENNLPSDGSGLIDIFFSDDDLTSNGFKFNGREFYKNSENGKFIEFFATFGTEQVRNVCGNIVGIKVRASIIHTKRDDDCVPYTAGSASISGVVGNLWDGFDATADEPDKSIIVTALRDCSTKSSIVQNINAVLAADAAGMEDIGTVLSGNVAALAGTTITLG